MIHFHSPLFLLLLLLVPAFWLKIRAIPKNSIGNTYSKTSILFTSRSEVRSTTQSWRCRYRNLILNSLQSACFCLLVIALARPQTGSEFTEIDASGRDIMLVLDISGSMQALDFFIAKQRVDRLTALKEVVKEFIDGRKGDRIGLVVFADNAFTQCPLTLDHQLLKTFVEKTDIGMAGQATAIGDALAIATKRLTSIKGDSKVVVLVSDGKSNAGSIDPIEAAKIARELKIKIHTIGIGESGPAPFPAKDPFGHTRIISRDLEFDEQTLKNIAAQTGGEYFNAKDTAKLAAIYQQIDALEKREEKAFQYIEYEERFLFFILFAVIIFIIEETLKATILRIVP